MGLFKHVLYKIMIEEREKIHLKINEDKSYRNIDYSLGRPHSTICRELHRFSTRFNTPQANQQATMAILKKDRKSLNGD